MDDDGFGDACDPDIDGDQILNEDDNCPTTPSEDQTDNDLDGEGDICDLDDDGDQFPDTDDNCPLVANPVQGDKDEDGVGDLCDPDIDGDAIANAADNCPNVSNKLQIDTDGDGQGDTCDLDDDNDGVADIGDNCPLIANPEQDDLEGDSQGDVCDPDDDNDGVLDSLDNCPTANNPAQEDTDSDGDGNACDTDDDDDGDPDLKDCQPTDPTVFHGNQESCNGKDDNCTGGIDEVGASGCVSHYKDNDNDGWGVSGDSKCLCEDASNKGKYTALKSGDCEDGDGLVYPNATELCNGGKDDNCDDVADGEDSAGCSDFYLDKDGDTWGVNQKKCLCKPSGNYKAIKKSSWDCNDNAPNVSPGAQEVCGGGDENCNGTSNEEGATNCKYYYPDADGDGYGAKVTGKCLCGAGTTYKVQNNSDCYDGNGNAKPGQGAWFKSHRGDGSFDYDCDGNETRRHTLPGGNCSTILGFCSATQKGFKGGVPACGKSGKFLDGCDSGFFDCDDKLTTIQQECH
jgi:hypothetical protein